MGGGAQGEEQGGGAVGKEAKLLLLMCLDVFAVNLPCLPSVTSAHSAETVAAKQDRHPLVFRT